MAITTTIDITVVIAAAKANQCGTETTNDTNNRHKSGTHRHQKGQQKIQQSTGEQAMQCE
jgi:hypothetical protein